jgi:glyoxylase-like metal-dependent hydrolase (beta-lactamase superfamily II)
MQITENIHALKIPFPSIGSAGQTVERFVYVYFIYGKRICMIDSGVSSAFSTIVDYLNKTGRSPEEIDLLIFTHSHPDHIGAGQLIKKISNCKTVAHPAARSWIEDIDLQYKERPTGTFYSLVAGSVDIDWVLKDIDHIDFEDGQNLNVYHTPGHSKGSISLFHEQDGALFAGDTIPVPGDRPIYENVFALIHSIRKLKGIEGVKVLCSSWLDPVYGDKIHTEMDKSLDYIQHVHEVTRKTNTEFPSLDSKELCSRILETLNQPEVPNVITSIEAHIRLKDYADLMDI